MPEDATKPEETPDGAAVFPLIPEELGVHPLLLAALHAYVFLEGSEATVLNPAVADEAMEYLVGYMQRLNGAELRRVREDFITLVGFAKSEDWPKQHVRFLQDFLKENGIGA
ncbi:MAG: hypothetical protein FJ304_05765 [Planctomycetes bacterium]|nr:hypothetical protein [Planctomycetota bacterium]